MPHNLLPYSWFGNQYFIDADHWDTVENVALRIWDAKFAGSTCKQTLSPANLTLIYNGMNLKEWATLQESNVDFSVGVYAHLSFPKKRG